MLQPDTGSDQLLATSVCDGKCLPARMRANIASNFRKNGEKTDENS